MVAANFDTLNALQNRLIRKALTYGIFVADYDTPALTAAPFDTAGLLQELPAGYVPFGYTNEDGVTFSGDFSTNDVTSGQSARPTRSDVETDTQTAQFTPQETNAAAVAVFENLLLDDLPAIGSATWEWSRPKVPATLFRRMIYIARDTSETGEPIYIVRHQPRALRTDRGDEQWARTEAISREVTFTAYDDEALGTDARTWIDGPGWRKLAADAGGGETGGGA